MINETTNKLVLFYLFLFISFFCILRMRSRNTKKVTNYKYNFKLNDN